MQKFKAVITVKDVEVKTVWLDRIEDLRDEVDYLIDNAISIKIKTMKSKIIAFYKDTHYRHFYINEYSGLTLIQHMQVEDFKYHSKVKLGSGEDIREMIFDVTKEAYDYYLSRLMKKKK